ncbi:hypothetical protein SAMN04488028_101305 [Reichenbachiella agariperforans]|uniref:Uncharacterized protein n=1 Tax=Reichenbachiella agariperforans TaxID=156994 RepID=A0A1M6JSJ8_REIAG|nr:hypothetical protein [Reichenbachiella agariperforans]SHJ49668.1 hypothetical protein SAMN04488028_101305 [Reichenbachiella agariperforans]
MNTQKNLGIWMDHSSADLIDIDTKKNDHSIASQFNFDTKEEALTRSEKGMHNKRQQMHQAYYKEISEQILNYDHVLLLGPTNAKSELHNYLNLDLHFKDIKIDIESTDDCTTVNDLVMSLDVTSFDCTDIGTTSQVALSVTDLSGNTTTETADVTVVDITEPTVNTQNITIVLDGSGNASITPADIDNGSSDNCTAVSNLILSLDVTTFDINDLGKTP